MIPQALTDWDYETIKDRATKGYLETDTFEFKPAIKSRDSTLDGRIKAFHLDPNKPDTVRRVIAHWYRQSGSIFIYKVTKVKFLLTMLPIP